MPLSPANFLYSFSEPASSAIVKKTITSLQPFTIWRPARFCLTSLFRGAIPANL